MLESDEVWAAAGTWNESRLEFDRVLVRPLVMSTSILCEGSRSENLVRCTSGRRHRDDRLRHGGA